MTSLKKQPNIDELHQIHDNCVSKVAIIGVESTGKTTLCQDLTAIYDSAWVVEYMRPYLKHKWLTPEGRQAGIGYDDLLPIAKGQIRTENQATIRLAHQAKTRGKQPLFCDTCLFELMVYAHWYQGRCPPKIEKAARVHRYDMVLLTELDVPWQADGLRDSRYERNAIHDAFLASLDMYGIHYCMIAGSRQQRVHQVVEWLNELNVHLTVAKL